tara:strand:+ start:1438 stop:2844 length:1407 start_codon:yes stop_codon:yes gene_type:complete
LSDKYDLVVIGAGPGGYVAAIRAAQLGLRVACIDKRDTLGGTCLNVGCIPSKSLLSASGKYEEASKKFADIGIELSGLQVNLKQMFSKKDLVVSELTKGIEFLFKKNKVEWLSGEAFIKSNTEVEVTFNSGKKTRIVADKIMIAVGSEPVCLPNLAFDEKKIVSSTGALSLKAVPKRLVVVGAGYIGLEMGSVWSRLGSTVTVVEFLDKIVPNNDQEIAKHFQRNLQKQGLNFMLGTKVIQVDLNDKGVSLFAETVKGGKQQKIDCDVVLVAVGRKPSTNNLGLEDIGVKRDKNGFILVDDKLETSVKNILAIGDCILGPMLAHKAEEEGVAAVEMIAGGSAHIDHNLVPSIIYTHPEVASVGKTEEQLKSQKVDYSVGKFPFSANSRARANDDTDGFVKILADRESDQILGVHIIGPEAGTLIHECATAMVYGASAEDIARTCHGHPTLNEAIKEAALAVDGRPIHM